MNNDPTTLLLINWWCSGGQLITIPSDTSCLTWKGGEGVGAIISTIFLFVLIVVLIINGFLMPNDESLLLLNKNIMQDCIFRRM